MVLRYNHAQSPYAYKGIISLLGSKIVGKADGGKLRENRLELGRNEVVEPVSIVFNISFWYAYTL